MKKYFNGHKIISLLLLAGAALVLYRLFAGLGAVSALSDSQPWGLTKSFNILSGAALAAGGSVIAAMVYVLGLRRFRPLVRPSLLMGFIAHTFVLGALLYDVGSPIDVWRIAMRPNIGSVMFLAFLCELIYSSAVICEFVPEFVTSPKYGPAAGFLHSIGGPVNVVAASALVLYQYTLGALYLVSPHRITPLWYTPWLPVLFFASAVAAGLGLVIIEAYISARSGRRGFDTELMGRLGTVMAGSLAVFIFIRILGVAAAGGFHLLGKRPFETVWFIIELCAFLLPAILLMLKGARSNPGTLLLASSLVAAGVVMNRLGIAVVGWNNASGVSYFPSAIEVYVSFFFVLAPAAIYAYASGALAGGLKPAEKFP